MQVLGEMLGTPCFCSLFYVFGWKYHGGKKNVLKMYRFSPLHVRTHMYIVYPNWICRCLEKCLEHVLVFAQVLCFWMENITFYNNVWCLICNVEVQYMFIMHVMAHYDNESEFSYGNTCRLNHVLLNQFPWSFLVVILFIQISSVPVSSYMAFVAISGEYCRSQHK